MNRSFFLCLAACRMRPSARDTLSRFCAGTWFAGPHSLWPPPFAPPAPRPVARPCSPASQLLWYRLIPASILHRLWLLAFPMQTRALCCDWSDVGSPGSRATSFHTCQVLRPRRAVQALALTRLSVLPSSFATASAPGISIFARLNGWPVCSPTDASRRPHGRPRTARGRCGSLLRHRVGLAPTTRCRSPGALRKILDTTFSCPHYGAGYVVSYTELPIADSGSEYCECCKRRILQWNSALRPHYKLVERPDRNHP